MAKMGLNFVWIVASTGLLFASHVNRTEAGEEQSAKDTNFFERRIRPILVRHCYECHSESSGEQQGGLLLDRKSGWIDGGDSGNAIVDGEPENSLLIRAVRYQDDELQMPPDGKIAAEEIELLSKWISRGAPGPAKDMGETEFSRLGDQDYLFQKAAEHWSFHPVKKPELPDVDDSGWSRSAVDRFVYRKLQQQGLRPSSSATSEVLLRRLHFALTGLPPSYEELQNFARNPDFEQKVDELLQSSAYGEHMARMWLDVVRYADTDSTYRPDTKTPHYFPFAFTYRDYVIRSMNADKSFAQFIKEQLAADLMGFEEDAPELAALGFLAVGPYANRNALEALDDWIDLTTRGLMGLTVACARCHDHKYEPIPTADYYALRGVFAAVDRIKPLDEKKLPKIEPGFVVASDEIEDYKKKRAEIEKRIEKAGNAKAKNNNRSIGQKIRETELAKLLAFHPGAPAHAMVVRDKKNFPRSFVMLRGEASNRGAEVSRRFVQILDAKQSSFGSNTSGRLELAERIVSAENPLSSRVIVNRVWGYLLGSYLVDTPSDFGLQGSQPSHPDLLDWLSADFAEHDWSIKHLVRRIVLSQTFQQASTDREHGSLQDPENRLLWKANRKHLSIEQLRDSMLFVSQQLDRTLFGRPQNLWGDKYSDKRAIYGFVNRFNLDPTLRAFDFPSPMQTHPKRGESIVATQALFTLNSKFVVDQAKKLIELNEFRGCVSDEDRTKVIFRMVFGRDPAEPELKRVVNTVKSIQRMNANLKKKVKVTEPWSLVAQSLLMSNEFQYVD